MASGVKKFFFVAGLLFAALFSTNASAAIINKYYATLAQAKTACESAHPSCGLFGSTTPKRYRYYPGWGDQFNYYGDDVGDAPLACSGKPYTSPSGQCRDTPYTPGECGAAGYYPDGAGNCAVAPTCSGGKSWNGSSCVCPGGQFDIGGTCGADPCNLGKSWDEVGQSCEFPDTPPTSCADGEIAAVNGSGSIVGCAPIANMDESCDYSQGYGADGYFLCSGQKAECEAEGGTHGYVDGSEVCIPDDYSPPICDSTQVVSMSSGGFVCSTPANVKPQDPTDIVDPSDASTPPGETPTTPSGQSAAPGTGTTGGGSGGTGTPGAPALEADEGTREAGKTGEGRSSADCAAPPICSGGDPQICALLRQQWETMCAQPDMLERVDGNQASVIGAKLDAGIDAVFTGTTASDVTGTVAADPTGGVGSAAEMGWFDAFVSDLVPSGSSCSSYSMNMPRVVLTFGCERLDWLKSFLGWMLYCYTVFFVWGTVFAPYRSPAGGE